MTEHIVHTLSLSLSSLVCIQFPGGKSRPSPLLVLPHLPLSICLCTRAQNVHAPHTAHSYTRPGKMYTCLPRIWVMRVRHVKLRWYCTRKGIQRDYRQASQHLWGRHWRKSARQKGERKQQLICLDREQNPHHRCTNFTCLHIWFIRKLHHN